MYRELLLAGCFAAAVFPHSVLAAYAVELPVEFASGAGTLSNHTARIVLDSATPGFNWSYNCNDISVVDSASSPIDFFLQSCDVVTQQAVIWVELPSIPPAPSSVRITLRYNDATAVSPSNAGNTFNDSGFLYHTQPYNNATPGPETRAEGDAIFNYDSVTTTAGYGCTRLNNANVDNSGVFGSNANIAYRLETILNVLVPGNYEFRYGNDYGHGGELRLDGTPLEATWIDDLWWGFNYAHPDVLTGSASLTSGAHSLDALGFELCCDGPAGLQFRLLPTGAWTNLDTSNTQMELLAPDCPLFKHRILTSEHRKGVELELKKTASDLSPSRGDTVTFTITIDNNGVFDATDVEVDDPIPAGFSAVSNISHSGTLTGSLLEWTVPVITASGTVSLTFDAVVQ